MVHAATGSDKTGALGQIAPPNKANLGPSLESDQYLDTAQ